MAQYELSSNGYKLIFPGPDSVEDYDKKSGRVGACLEDACASTGYRSTLPEWADAFTPVLEKITGIIRGIDEAATEKARSRAKNPDNVKPVPEKFKLFNARARQAYAGDDEAKLAELQEAAQAVAATIEIDPSPSVRQAAVKAGELAKADQLLSQDEDVMEAKIEKFLAAVGEFDLARDEDGKPERNSLARLISRYIDALL